MLGKHHSAVGEDEVAKFKTGVLIGFLLSSAKGAWDSSDAFNQVFPDYNFTQIENFLSNVWEGKV